MITVCQLNSLSISYSKSKAVVFSKSWHPQKWSLSNLTTEQTKYFKFLGITLNHKLSWVMHHNRTINLAKCSASQIKQFYFMRGNQCAPAAEYSKLKHYLKSFTVSPYGLLLLIGKWRIYKHPFSDKLSASLDVSLIFLFVLSWANHWFRQRPGSQLLHFGSKFTLELSPIAYSVT